MLNYVDLGIRYLVLEHDDPKGNWLGSQKAGMLGERRTFKLPSFPASQLQTFETNNILLAFNSIGVKRIRGRT
jgi:hypothetical protein